MQLPSYRWRFVHLVALWAFGVSQPVFSMLKGNPEFLVVRGSTRMDVVVFALILALGAPLLVVAVEAVASIVWAMLARALHIVAVWCFSFLAALQLVRLLGPERGVTLLLPIVPAALAALAYMRWPAFRSFLSIAVALPVLGVLVFVGTVPLAVDDAAGADVVVAGNTPVVLVVFDEFPVSSLLEPDGAIDATRYPNFARLARQATWYPHATSVHEYTTQAVPAILTGMLPQHGQVPTLSDHPDNLFTLLGEQYALHVTEVVTRLCPVRYCPDASVRAPALDRQRGLFYDVGVGYLHRVLPESMRGELPPIGDRWGGFGSGGDTIRNRLLGAADAGDIDDVVNHRVDDDPRTSFMNFLSSLRPAGRGRSLYFEHVEMPHTPWEFLPSGRAYGNSLTIDGIYEDSWNSWTTEPWLVDQALQRHLLQVGYTDRLIGRLLKRLHATGLYDRALVIVTADHGESFEPGGSRRLVTHRNLADIAAVPLFVKYPAERAGRIDLRDAKTIDILPTIADVLGVRMPWKVDGLSLQGQPRARTVTVSRRAGGVVTGRFSEVESAVRATARRNAALFGEGTDSMYRLGRHPELLGRSAQSLPGPPVDGASVQFDGGTQLGDVHLSSGFVPSRVVGELSGAVPPSGTDLAIVVNGRVSALTRSYSLDGRQRFSAMVPEDVFHDGTNTVGVYIVTRVGGEIALSLLGEAGTSSYAVSVDGRTIVLPSGDRASVESGRLAGQVESWSADGTTFRASGWAADVRDGALPDRVLLFSGRKLVFAGATTIFRWDVGATQRRPEMIRSGWAAEVPIREVRDTRLTVFAVRGNVASELTWPGSSKAVIVAASRRTVP
jgi:hypothetical protein